MLENVCPLCGKNECFNKEDSKNNAIAYHCDTFCQSLTISGNIEYVENYDQKLRLFNLIFEHVNKHQDGYSNNWKFYYDPEHVTNEEDETKRINLAEIPYPRTISEKADRSLMNLSRRIGDYSDMLPRNTALRRAVFAENTSEENRMGFLDVLVDMGYLKQPTKDHFAITAKGWERVDELSRNESTAKQGFIAMSFSDETTSIFHTLKKAIADSGYRPLRIDEKEHNDQIVPEIFYEIDQSKFLVMDVTMPNYGAYYEAGYALGKGKPVIICCRKKEFEGKERPHFDIRQKSTIVWEDEDELIKRLIKRIKATIK